MKRFIIIAVAVSVCAGVILAALTAIRGAVITFQLTPEGENKLTAAGIALGQQVHRALLLDLCRTGDAYTSGSGVDDPALASQIELDFTNDPDPETAFQGVKCEWDAWQVDHKTPWSQGGKTTVENGQVACPECNEAKGGNV
jgi:hypothetical protein